MYLELKRGGGCGDGGEEAAGESSSVTARTVEKYSFTIAPRFYNNATTFGPTLLRISRAPRRGNWGKVRSQLTWRWAL